MKEESWVLIEDLGFNIIKLLKKKKKAVKGWVRFPPVLTLNTVSLQGLQNVDVYVLHALDGKVQSSHSRVYMRELTERL